MDRNSGNPRRAGLLSATALAVLALVATPMTASAQRMKTEIPKSITTPDRVETRLGTLRFRDGLPDEYLSTDKNF